MSSQLGIIWQDFRGICRVCGLFTGVKWLLMIALHFGECRRSGTLAPADAAMGDGPFRATLRGVTANMLALKAFANIREIWVRDAYLGDGYLQIGPNAMVLDLGANTGIFTSLALSHGPGVRVVAVEPNAALNDEFRRNLTHTGWQDRATLVRCFLGGKTDFQQDALAHDECRDVPFVSEDQFVAQYKIDRIDFLKCDIEGSEFDLYGSHSKLLAITNQMAIELHDQAGDRQSFIRLLEQAGFQTKVWRTAPRDCIVLAKRA